MSSIHWMPLIGLLALSNTSLANQPETENQYVAPTPIKRIAPKYPKRALKHGQEGWVLMSFVVSDEGQVSDVIVEESNGFSRFEKAAVKAVQRWQYTPASLNGLPVNSAKNRVRLEFRLSENSPVRDSVRRKFLSIAKLVDTGDMVKAKTELEQLTTATPWKLSEDAYIGLLEAWVYADTDQERFIQGLHRSIRFEDTALTPQLYLVSLKELFAAEANMGEYAKALQTAEQLKPLLAELPEEQAFLKTVEKFEHQVAASKQLKTKANISHRKHWQQELVGNAIKLDVLDGKVKDVQARCDKHYQSLSLKQGEAVAIPEAWGNCTLLVKGNTGTKLELTQEK